MARTGRAMGKSSSPAPARGLCDPILIGIATTAILLLLGDAGLVVSAAVQLPAGRGVDAKPSTALLIDVALLLFVGQRRRDRLPAYQGHFVARERAHSPERCEPAIALVSRRTLVEATGTMLLHAARSGRAVALVMIESAHSRAHLGHALPIAQVRKLVTVCGITATGRSQ